MPLYVVPGQGEVEELQPSQQPPYPGPYQSTIPQPQPYYPYPQPMRAPTNPMTILIVIGGVLAFLGATLVAVISFWMATVDINALISYNSIRWIYAVDGAGQLVTGVGLMIAFIGLALRQR